MNAKKKEMNIEDLISIKECLSKMNEKTGHGLGYEINLNLSLVTKPIDDWTERLEKFKNKHYEKTTDEKTDLVFVVKKIDGLIAKIDGKEVVLSDDKTVVPKIYSIIKPDDFVQESFTTAKRFVKKEINNINVAFEKFSDEKFNLDFIEFPPDELKNSFKNKALDGLNLSPLVGILIF